LRVGKVESAWLGGILRVSKVEGAWLAGIQVPGYNPITHARPPEVVAESQQSLDIRLSIDRVRPGGEACLLVR